MNLPLYRIIICLYNILLVFISWITIDTQWSMSQHKMSDAECSRHSKVKCDVAYNYFYKNDSFVFVKDDYGFEVIDLRIPQHTVCLRLLFCRPLYLPLCSLCTIYACAYVHMVVACVCWHSHRHLTLTTFTFWEVCVLLNKFCLTCLQLLPFSSTSQIPKTAFPPGIRTSTQHFNTHVFQETPFVDCLTILFTVYKTC